MQGQGEGSGSVLDMVQHENDGIHGVTGCAYLCVCACACAWVCVCVLVHMCVCVWGVSVFTRNQNTRQRYGQRISAWVAQQDVDRRRIPYSLRL